MLVPPSTAVKRNRVHNIDTDRLRNRRAFLAVMLRHSNENFESRMAFGARVAEMVAIERELVTRGALSGTERITRP